MHVHISCPDGEAKFWLEPKISLTYAYSLSVTQLKEIEKIVKERENDIIEAWQKHFEGRG